MRQYNKPISNLGGTPEQFIMQVNSFSRSSGDVTGTLGTNIGRFERLQLFLFGTDLATIVSRREASFAT
jgi:hypothetical protein